MVMRRRRLEWFEHVKRRDETECIRAVVEMKMRPRGSSGGMIRPERDLKAWNISEEWAKGKKVRERRRRNVKRKKIEKH